MAGPSKSGFFHDILSVSFARVVAMLSFLITNILIARYLGPEGKGLTAIFTNVPNLVVALAAIGLDKSSAYMIGKKIHSLDAVVSGLVVGSIFAVMLGLAVSGCYFMLSWGEGYTWLNVGLTMGVVVFIILQKLMNGVMLGQRMILLFSVTRWLPQAMQALWIIGAIALASLAVPDVIGGMLFGFAAVVVYSVVVVLRRVKFRFAFDAACLKALLAYGAVASVADFLVFLNYKVQIFVLQAISTVEQVGVFSLGQNFGELLWQAPSMMSAVILSRSASSTDPDEFARKLGVLLRLSLLVCTMIGVVIGAACIIGVPFIFGEAFAASTFVYLTLLPGVVGIVSFKILAVDLVGQGKARVTAMIMAPSILLNVALGLALIPVWGAVGAALAASVTYLCISTATILLYCRERGMRPLDFIRPRRSDFFFLADRVPPLRRLLGRR
jgi:O-antigen/teichoic acid export membrane protein